MASAGVQVDEVMPCPMGSGAALDALLRAVAADGQYQAVQVAPDRIQFARTFRPTWALVAGWVSLLFFLVGLLFFLVKTTETCLAVIESDHRGTRIRLTGRLSSAALGRVRSALADGPTSSSQVVPAAPTVGQATPSAFTAGAAVANPPQGVIDLTAHGSPRPASPPPTSTVPPVAPVVAAATPAPVAPAPQVQPPAAPVAAVHAPPAWPNPSSSAAAVRIPEPPSRTPDTGAVHDRADLSGSDATLVPAAARRPDPAVSVPIVQLDDGRRIELRRVNLLGRDPVAGADDAGAQLIALDDPSRSVSKTHLSLTHDGSAWLVTDRHSTNGVEVVSPDGRSHRLPPGQPVPVPVAATVRFGERSLQLVAASVS